ncbi:MAG: hypothetical protein WDO16_19205 [Bacteroidota bacterium]
MWLFTYIFFIPMTILFLILSGGCLVYFLMGVGQLVTGYKENNSSRKEGGLVATILSLALLIAAIYFYLQWVWIW